MCRKSSWETSLLTLVSKGRIFQVLENRRDLREGIFTPLFIFKSTSNVAKGSTQDASTPTGNIRDSEAGRRGEYQPPKLGYLTLSLTFPEKEE